MKHSITRSILLLAILLLSLTVLAGCTVQVPQATAVPAATAAPTTVADSAAPTVAVTATEALKTFNAQELAKYNGQNGNPAYIAVDGNVYDVTNVPQWKNGTHAGRFQAGVDQTEALKQSPHGPSKLDNIPIVGIYQP